MPYFWIMCATLTGTLSNASETSFVLEPQSTIAFSYGVDDNKNQSSSLFLDFEFSNFQQLGIGYSRNKNSQDNSATERYTLLTSTSAHKKFSLDARFNATLSPDAIEEYTASSAINLNLQDWHVAVTPQLTAITFFLSSNRENKFDIYAKGAEISASYFGFEQFYFSANYFKNVFSEKPVFLNPTVINARNINRISRILALSKIIELGSGLEKQRISLSAGRFFHWGSLGIGWSYVTLFNVAQWLDFSILAPYQANINLSSYHASINFPINKRVSSGILLGWQTASNAVEKLFFSSAELSYHW